MAQLDVGVGTFNHCLSTTILTAHWKPTCFGDWLIDIRGICSAMESFVEQVLLCRKGLGH